MNESLGFKLAQMADEWPHFGFAMFWAFASPVKPDNPPILFPPIPNPSGGNGGGDRGPTSGLVVTHLVRQLASQSDIRFREARLSAVFLRVSPGDQASNNIADFRSIGCLFLYGGDAPPTGKSNAFSIMNRWPEQWDEWSNKVLPRSIQGPALGEIEWQKTQALMSVEKADYLLKAAGYVQRYRGVVILKLANRPLGYCFSKVDNLRNLNVDLLTGSVSEVRDCSVSL
ncbi:MAG: hypothetical protein Q9221_006466 [Calogaya cf. arnoldii]